MSNAHFQANSQSSRTKILFVGLGAIGQRHLRNLHALLGDRAEFLAWRSLKMPTPTLAPDMSVRDDVSLEIEYSMRTFADLDEALSRAPQIAVIANPTSLHIETALRCARAGCHLFIEKPLSHSLQNLDELAQIVAQKNLTAFVAYPLRFHPACQLVKKLLDENAIGTLLTARLAFGESLPGWHPYEDYRQSYAARRDLGGGVVLTQIHDLDLALWLFGTPRRVFALGGTWSELETDVEDCVSALWEFQLQNGRSFPVHIQQDYLQKPPQRLWEITGSRAKIVLDLAKSRVEIVDFLDGESKIHDFGNFERNQMFLDEMRHFLDCVASKTAPLVTLEEGAQSLQLALATLCSMESGEVVDVDKIAEMLR